MTSPYRTPGQTDEPELDPFPSCKSCGWPMHEGGDAVVNDDNYAYLVCDRTPKSRRVYKVIERCSDGTPWISYETR